MGNPEISGQQNTLFPLNPDTVVNALRNLEHSSNQMLDMITYARGPMGAANELYANIPTNELILWHISNNDFTENGRLLYRVGLLYGLDLTAHIATETDLTSDIKLTDAEAFRSALRYLKETYRGLKDDPEIPEWQRQKERELVYTGSDILTLASAARRDAVLDRLKELGVDRLGTDIYEDELAQYVGLVDGAVFVNAYRALSTNSFPMHFPNPAVEYIPVYNPHTHTIIGTTDTTSKLGNLDDVFRVTLSHNHKPLHDMEVDKDEVIIRGPIRFVQIGPNDFANAVEIKNVSFAPLSKKRLGAYALAGALVDASYVFIDNGIPFQYLPATTLVTLCAGIMTERRLRKRIELHFESRGFRVTSH